MARRKKGRGRKGRKGGKAMINTEMVSPFGGRMKRRGGKSR